jgi:hypothetical protein
MAPVLAAAINAAAAAAAATEEGFSVELDLVPTLVPLLSAPGSTAVQEMAAFALARLAQVPAYQTAVAQVSHIITAVVTTVVLVCEGVRWGWGGGGEVHHTQSAPSLSPATLGAPRQSDLSAA